MTASSEERAIRGIAIDPAWPKRVTVITDSVLASGRVSFTSSLPDWQVSFAGHPSLALPQAADLVRAQSSVGSVAVVSLGTYGLWEPNRRNFARWADAFDRNAEELLATLKERGAHKVVWVLLREPAPNTVPPFSLAMSQFQRLAWYFPYVNERLRALKARHPEVALADWTGASRAGGLTVDLIHVNAPGAVRLAEVIKSAMLIGHTLDTAEPSRPASREAAETRTSPALARTTDADIDTTPTASLPARRSSVARPGWVIQVGAFPEKGKAADRLKEARAIAGPLLAQANPFTEKVSKGSQDLYRARFWGLDQGSATSACNEFRRHGMDCLMVPTTTP